METTRKERFEAMFRDHYAAVSGYALRRAPAAEAQDVVADTFVVAWRRLDEVPADPLPWLYGVARRTLANQRRGARRGEALRRAIGAEPGVFAGDPADAVGEAEVVQLALGRLSERDRETLMLVAWDGCTPARAARAAGCSRAAFAVRLHRARGRLAAQLRALEGSSSELRPNLSEASEARR